MASTGPSATVDASALVATLARLGAAAPVVGSVAATDTARADADQLRGMVPHRSGRLAASVRVDRTADGATLGMYAPYARYIDNRGDYVARATAESARAMATRATIGLERVL